MLLLSDVDWVGERHVERQGARVVVVVVVGSGHRWFPGGLQGGVTASTSECAVSVTNG